MTSDERRGVPDLVRRLLAQSRMCAISEEIIMLHEEVERKVAAALEADELTSDERRELVDRARVMAQESAANGFVATAADLGRFAAALEAGLPEEREGQCWCDECVNYGGVWVGST